MKNRELLDQYMTDLAQGVINIDTGYCTIEAGSRVHKAMTAIVDLYVKGHVHATQHPVKETAAL